MEGKLSFWGQDCELGNNSEDFRQKIGNFLKIHRQLKIEEGIKWKFNGTSLKYWIRKIQKHQRGMSKFVGKNFDDRLRDFRSFQACRALWPKFRWSVVDRNIQVASRRAWKCYSWNLWNSRGQEICTTSRRVKKVWSRSFEEFWKELLKTWLKAHMESRLTSNSGSLGLGGSGCSVWSTWRFNVLNQIQVRNRRRLPVNRNHQIFNLEGKFKSSNVDLFLPVKILRGTKKLLRRLDRSGHRVKYPRLWGMLPRNTSTSKFNGFWY